jgi:hypothetical protein
MDAEQSQEIAGAPAETQEQIEVRLQKLFSKLRDVEEKLQNTTNMAEVTKDLVQEVNNKVNKVEENMHLKVNEVERGIHHDVETYIQQSEYKMRTEFGREIERRIEESVQYERGRETVQFQKPPPMEPEVAQPLVEPMHMDGSPTIGGSNQSSDDARIDPMPRPLYRPPPSANMRADGTPFEGRQNRFSTTQDAPRNRNHRFSSVNTNIQEPPSMPMTEVQSNRLSTTDRDFYIKLNEGSRILGGKYVEPPLLQQGRIQIWKSEIEAFVRMQTNDGCLVNVMYGLAEFENDNDQFEANCRIYDIMISASKKYLDFHAIPLDIRKRRNGVKLTRHIWSKFHGIAASDRREEARTEFQQVDGRFDKPAYIIQAVYAKFQQCDEVNDLTDPDDGEQHVISEREMVSTILGFLPREECWSGTRTFFQTHPNLKNRQTLEQKILQRLKQAGIVQVSTDVKDAMQADLDANAATRTPWKQSGRNKNYGDSGHLSYNKMDNDKKLKLLVNYLRQAERVPKLEYKDYQNFLEWINKQEASGADVEQCVQQYVDQQVNAVINDPELPSISNDPIKAAMEAIEEATYAGLDNDSSDGSIDAGGASDTYDTDDDDLGSD